MSRRNSASNVTGAKAPAATASAARFHTLSAPRKPLAPSDRTAIIAQLRREVVARFERQTGSAVMVIPVGSGGLRALEAARNPPTQPVCRTAAAESVCVDSWRAHLEELRNSLRPHWHRCDNEKWCGVVPVTVHGTLVGVCRLVCEGDKARGAFQREVELLAGLVENFTADMRSRRDAGAVAAVTSEPRQPLECPTEETRPSTTKTRHPQVRRAVRIIEHRAREPQLNVGAIARELGMNATYLAHVFHEETGVRMSHFIAQRRIEIAKSLLETTNWQIKRIAFESGHGNANWFSHVFRKHTSETPRAYRNHAIQRGARS